MLNVAALFYFLKNVLLTETIYIMLVADLQTIFILNAYMSTSSIWISHAAVV